MITQHIHAFTGPSHLGREGVRGPSPSPELRQEALPEREWGLSAAQVAISVAVIVLVSEVIGLLL